MTVAVIHNYGSPQFYSWGVTDAANRYPIGSNTLFALGSLSKGITAEVVACLVNEGRLSWDDNLATLLPPGTPLSADAQKITLLELVNSHLWPAPSEYGCSDAGKIHQLFKQW